MSDLSRTTHYTTNAEEICGNLTRYIPADARLIEPFVGDGHLLSLFPGHHWETYDIAIDGRDTILNPPSYNGKWVITNPPYLAKNKAKENHRAYSIYEVDDLYKAFLLSIESCEGGIVIVPTNFFADERSKAVRIAFLDVFDILEMNAFDHPVFDTTTYSVCCFAFKRKRRGANTVSFLVNGKHTSLHREYGYRFAGELFNELEKQKAVFGRLQRDVLNNDYITRIKLYALDTRDERIRCEIDDKPYYGKNSDRMVATLTCKFQLSKRQEEELVKQFNKSLEQFRRDNDDLPLTNYRDFGRRRIGFTFAYQLMSKIYFDLLTNGQT